jgi:hypothetical protein
MAAMEFWIEMELPIPPRKQLPRRVRFSSQVETSKPGPLALVKEDLKELWYNQEDLQLFKSQVRNEIVNNHSDTNSSTPLLLSRGLESCTPNRLRHRILAMQCTLSEHRKGMGADHTSSIARRCSSWSTELAFVQGCHDYCTVYQPSISKMIPSVNSIAPPAQLFPPSFGMRKITKRVSVSLSPQEESLLPSQHQSRSVRRRFWWQRLYLRARSLGPMWTHRDRLLYFRYYELTLLHRLHSFWLKECLDWLLEYRLDWISPLARRRVLSFFLLSSWFKSSFVTQEVCVCVINYYPARDLEATFKILHE